MHEHECFCEMVSVFYYVHAQPCLSLRCTQTSALLEEAAVSLYILAAAAVVATHSRKIAPSARKMWEQ